MTEESTEQQIVIGGYGFKAVKTIDMTKEITICKRRVEDQKEMADHAIMNPAVFVFELELLNADKEYDLLDTLHTRMTPFDLTTHRGQYQNMILAKLSDRKSGLQSNSTSATITVQQILIGKVSTTAVVQQNTDALPVEVTTASEDSYPGSRIPKTEIYEWPETVVPAHEEEETIVQHCDGLTAKLDALRSMNRMVPKV